jgi:hypothetical protein
MVNAGKESGESRPCAGAELFATTFSALIEGVILLAKTRGERKYMEREFGKRHQPAHRSDGSPPMAC